MIALYILGWLAVSIPTCLTAGAIIRWGGE